MNSTFLYEHIQRKHRKHNDNVSNNSHSNNSADLINHSKHNKCYLNTKENLSNYDQCIQTHCCVKKNYKFCNCCKYCHYNNDNTFNCINQHKYQQNNKNCDSCLSNEPFLIAEDDNKLVNQKTITPRTLPSLSSQKSTLKSLSSLTSAWG